MARGNYMIDDDESSNSCHEHVHATTIHASEKIADDNEEEKEDQVEHKEQVEHIELIEHIEPVESPTDISLSNDKKVRT